MPALRLPKLHPYMMFVVLAWAANFSIVKIAYREFTPAAVALSRYILMMPVLVLACQAMKISLRVPRHCWPRLIFAGFIASGIYMVLFMEGMKTASAAQGAIALATAPIFMSFFSILAGHDQFRWPLLWGSLLAFAGVIVVAMGGSASEHGSVGGTLIVLSSAVVWSWSVILMKPLLEEIHPFAAMTLSSPGAFIALIPYGLLPMIHTNWSGISPVGWGSLMYLALVAGAMAFCAYYKSLLDLGPARTGMIQYLVPPTAGIFSYFILHDPVGPLRWAGLAIVLTGVWIVMRKGRQAPVNPASAAPTGR